MAWVVQTLLTDDPSGVEVAWDTWNIGVCEEGIFRALYCCYCQEDADRLVAALEWYETFQFGVIPADTKPPEAKRPRGAKPARKKPPVRKRG